MARQYNNARPKDLRYTVGKLLDYMGRHKLLLLLVAVLVTFSALANLLGTYMIRPVVNDLVDGDMDALIRGVVITACIYAVGALSSLGYTQTMVKAAQKVLYDIRRDLSYMTYAPILFISAATGQRVPRLFEMINYVHNQSCMRISTGMLNNILADAQTRVQPPTDKGKRLKIYYMTQVGVCPPHFVVFCNEKKLFHFSYQRYLENCIRNVFGLEGTPVIMSIREKGDKEE